jgi:hypothetical protein
VEGLIPYVSALFMSTRRVDTPWAWWYRWEITGAGVTRNNGKAMEPSDSSGFQNDR